MSEQEVLLGGWTKYHLFTAEDQEVFNEAMRGFVLVKYTLTEVATQVVKRNQLPFQV